MSGGSGARVNAYTITYMKQQQLAEQESSDQEVDMQSDAGMESDDQEVDMQSDAGMESDDQEIEIQSDAGMESDDQEIEIQSDDGLQEQGDIEPFESLDALDAHDEPVITDIHANPVPSIEDQDDDDCATLPGGAIVNTQIFDIKNPIQIAKYDAETHRVLETAFAPGFDGDLTKLRQKIADLSNFEVREVTRLRNKPVSDMHAQFKQSYGVRQTCRVYHGTAHADNIARVGFRGAASRRAKFGRGIYSSSNVYHALAYGQLTAEDTLTFLVVELHLGPIALGREDQVLPPPFYLHPSRLFLTFPPVSTSGRLRTEHRRGGDPHPHKHRGRHLLRFARYAPTLHAPCMLHACCHTHI